jgi:hypothetical protein
MTNFCSYSPTDLLIIGTFLQYLFFHGLGYAIDEVDKESAYVVAASLFDQRGHCEVPSAALVDRLASCFSLGQELSPL